MYTLALNYGRDWARKKKNSERCIDRLSREYANNDAQSPGRIVEADQEAEGLNLALSMLTGDRREMVLLKYRHERSIKEIAEVFDLSESAVKMRLQRALGELGETLKRQRSGAKNR